MAIEETAFIHHDLYKDGIKEYFKLGCGKKLLIGLLNRDGRLLAISGYKWKETEEATDEQTVCLSLSDWSGTGEGANYANKTLTLPTIKFDYTASVTGDSGDDAKFFAVIDITNVDDGSFDWIPTKIEDTLILVPTALTGGTNSDMVLNSEQGIANFGTSIKVLMFGSLSNTPSIDATTNFYFSGATIKFTEAAN